MVLLAEVFSGSEVVMELLKPNRLEDAMLVVLAKTYIKTNH